MHKLSWFNRRKSLPFPLFAIFLLILSSCTGGTDKANRTDDIFSMDNLVAWCIVPFDAMERSPEERAEMLDGLGFRRMAWDWRMEHIDMLSREISVLQKHDIELTAVWIWLDNPDRDELPPHLERIFDAVERSGTQTTYWVSFSDNYFEGFGEEEKVLKAARSVLQVHDRVRNSGGKIALYNHMGWFGEPENQVRIIESTGRDSIGIVYNFHHAHHHADDFPRLLDIMMPYLYTVNLNGMRRDGPKILDIGKGDLEGWMIKTLMDSGFDGTVGILGHTDGEDIREVLKRNLGGLHMVLDRL